MYIIYYKKKHISFTNVTISNFNRNMQHACTVAWVRIKGIIWKVNDILTLDIDEHTNMPIFASIQLILICKNDEVLCQCRLLETTLYSQHYFAKS